MASLLLVFFFNCIGPIPTARADAFYLPSPGQMVSLSPAYSPVVLKGIKLDSKNPFRFHFFVDTGNSLPHREKGKGGGYQEQLKKESSKLIKYFLASLTIPEKDLWVNLSPYEKDRIVPKEFGQTEMGRDLLAQDYMLKQITASLIYPESQLSVRFSTKEKKEYVKLFRKKQCTYTEMRKLRKAIKVGLSPSGIIFLKGRLFYQLGEGEAVSDFVDRKSSRVREVMRSAAYALGRLHATGIVHGDIYSGHVFVEEKNNKLKVFFIDFGSTGNLERDIKWLWEMFSNSDYNLLLAKDYQHPLTKDQLKKDRRSFLAAYARGKASIVDPAMITKINTSPWNQKNIHLVFDQKMLESLPVSIELTNVKAKEPKVTLKIKAFYMQEKGMDIPWAPGHQEYLIDVFINETKTGCIQIARDDGEEVYTIVSFHPIGDFYPSGYIIPGLPIYDLLIHDTYSKRGVASTILNWLAWTAHNNSVSMKNYFGTGTFNLLYLYCRYFVDVLSGRSLKKVRENGFFSKNILGTLGITPVDSNERKANIKVSLATSPDIYHIDEINGNSLGLSENIKITENGMVYSSDGRRLLVRVGFMDNILVSGQPRFLQKPEIKILRTRKEKKKKEDNAMSQSQQIKRYDPGGIDLNPAQLSMQVKKQGDNFKFDFNGATIDAAQVTGATFTIDSMRLVINLPLELGLVASTKQETLMVSKLAL